MNKLNKNLLFLNNIDKKIYNLTGGGDYDNILTSLNVAISETFDENSIASVDTRKTFQDKILKINRSYGDFKKISSDKTKLTQEVIEQSKIDTDNADLNKKITEYNTKITAYNKKINDYNMNVTNTTKIELLDYISSELNFTGILDEIVKKQNEINKLQETMSNIVKNINNAQNHINNISDTIKDVHIPNSSSLNIRSYNINLSKIIRDYLTTTQDNRSKIESVFASAETIGSLEELKNYRDTLKLTDDDIKELQLEINKEDYKNYYHPLYLSIKRISELTTSEPPKP